MQVLTTKLYAPPHRAELVSRPRLLERMEEGAQRKLTLLSAPAGFGKTTVVSEWVAQTGNAAAWLSLDADDSDPTRFLAHLVAALQTTEPHLGEGVRAALQAPQSPPTPWLLTELLNDISALSTDVVLVLDDYHAVDDEAVDEALRYLIDHLPPHMRFVLTTRQDPELRLANLRAKAQLTELRAADLRFTPEETAAFLNQAMGLDVSADDIALLEARTEGWIAGLQLAALSMRGRDDVTGFIASFAGDHRYVVDYLLEEVLKRQPERVEAFLLQSSILDRLSGPLCDAVTAQEGSAALLDTLERANLFLVPLDETRRWYRYHQLFRDVLRAHLTHEHGDLAATLHARASAWFEAAALPDDAVRHALASGNVERAAGLIERLWRTMDSTFRSAAWSAWVEQLPGDAVRARPVLAVGKAWALLNAGALEDADRQMQDLEALLPSLESHVAQPGGVSRPQVTFDDEQEFRSLPGTVASARAYHALAVGNPATSVAYARQALALLRADDHIRRGIPLGLLSVAHWANGDLEDAHDILYDALNGFRAAGVISASISCTFGLADILVAQGRLRQASQLYQDAFRLIEEPANAAVPGTAELHVGLADIRREQGDLRAAEMHLRSAEELGERAVLTGDRARLRTIMARLESGLGNPERALALLDEADRLHVRSPMPDLHPVAARRARVWLEQGRLAEATAWARDRALSARDPLSYMLEFEHLVLARVLLWRGRQESSKEDLDRALVLLGRLLQAAEAGGRSGSAIEILVLQALVLAAKGDARAAALPLSRALAFAEPEGYVQVFLDEGAPMKALLQDATRHGQTASYARRLLKAHGSGASLTRAAKPSAVAHEALTERESEVLRLLGTDLSGPEIARELRVSLNTLRTHVRNIYGKLGVNSRRAAVRRAEDLEVL